MSNEEKLKIALKNLLDALPHCIGHWDKKNKKFDLSCNKVATWYSTNWSEAYCDEHMSEDKKELSFIGRDDFMLENEAQEALDVLQEIKDQENRKERIMKNLPENLNTKTGHKMKNSEIIFVTLFFQSFIALIIYLIYLFAK